MVHAIPGLEAILPPSLQSLGSKVGVLRPSWLQVGGLSCNIGFLGTFWLQVGGSWGHLGSNLDGVGCKLGDLGAICA